MIIEYVDGDESRIKWSHGGEWKSADLVDLIDAYEAEPIKHGRWRDNKVAFHRVCSKCGAVVRQDISLIYLLECMEKVGHLNYCPNCGAKMDLTE